MGHPLGVTSYADPDAPSLDALVAMLTGVRFAVLTGAGISTDSGIPDYRSPGRPPRNPIQHRQFLTDAAWRRRYWARSVLGWERFRAARPNPTHHALARLERSGLVTGVVTQNVDRLHHAAGSRRVVELHGALAEVRCLDCAAFESRDALQLRLRARNPWLLDRGEELRPDGDVELDGAAIDRFEVADCTECGGVLMPNVVFFGGTVARSVVDEAMGHVESAAALLVLGSSLTVFSGFRFVRRAAELGKPVAIVNLGSTRGDPQATLKLDAPLGEVVPRLADALGTPPDRMPAARAYG
ncbi:MAG: NAD-dependent protein deacetylase [Deltaproteobacteria bacterium]|nr:NAD-dependent protein deacetylase [Deltaproteobacteria bacterium]